MENFSAFGGQTKRYGLKAWVRAFYLIFAAAGLCGGAFIYMQSAHPSASGAWVLPLFAAAMVVGGAYLGVSAFQQFVELAPESVSSGGLLRTRTLRRDAILGWRTISSRNGSYLVLEGRTPEDKRLSISSSFDFDDDWAAFVQTLPDLDEKDRQELLDQIAGDTGLGETSEARLAKLKQAKTVAVALSAVAIGAALALFFLRGSIRLNLFGALDALLVVLPWVVLLLQARSPLLYSIDGRKKDPRASLLYVVMASAFGLIASPFGNVHSSVPFAIFGYGCVPGLILGVALFSVSPKGPNRIVSLLLLIGIGCFYGNGVMTQVNTQLDNSAARPFTTQVVGMHVSSGRSTTYYLRLATWDPPGGNEDVSVSGSLYRSVQVGDPVCIAARDGALHVGWYTVGLCD